MQTICLTDGTSSRTGSGEREADARRSAACLAAGEIGAAEPVFLGFSDQELDAVPLLQIIQPLERLLKDIRPRTVFTHFSGDLNLDHVVAARAALTACRPNAPTSPTAIFAFETLSSTEWHIETSPGFHPNTYVDVADTLRQKIVALRHYGGEMHEPPHPRSLDSVSTLAHRRGYEVGLHAAEAFALIRYVDANSSSTITHP